MAKILIVEDENIVAWDIKETLEKLGHSVVDLVVSGEAAIQAAQTAQPDLVLMDIQLAGAIDGITAGDEIYHHLAIPVVYLTAHADEITLARATKTAPFGYIVKPFQSPTLHSTIKVALERSQLEASARLTHASSANILNSIGSAIIITDRQGLVTFINPIAQKLTGWDRTAAMGVEIDRVFQLIWEKDGTPIENPSVRAMRLQQQVNSEDRCWLLGKDNLEIPIADTATPIYTPAGEIVGSIIVFQDNTERLSVEMDLWERNQDLESFQFKLISQLQVQAVEATRAIACSQMLDTILTQAGSVEHECELIQLALQQLGTSLEADYCWYTLFDCQDTTATIVCEYIDPARHIYPTSKIGYQTDVPIYSHFYNYLFEGKSWIDPPRAIIPSIYLELLDPAARMLVCPIFADLSGIEDRVEPLDVWPIGEIGIITTGKSLWTPIQARLISQIFSYSIQLVRQPDRQMPRQMQVAANTMHQQLDSIDPVAQNSAGAEDDRDRDRELAINLKFLRAQWQRRFQLIDTLMAMQTASNTTQITCLSDLEFGNWMVALVESCAEIAARYQQNTADLLTGSIPIKLSCPFATLELIVLELFENACKYTPQFHLIRLEVNIHDRQLQLSIVSLGIELSPPQLEIMFLPFAPTPDAGQLGINGLGLALVTQILPLVGGTIRAKSDRDATRLILTVPLSWEGVWKV